MAIALGAELPLRLTLGKGETNLFPLAHVYDSTDTEISGSPFVLTSIANGLYSNKTVSMPASPFVTIEYLVYNDSGHTSLSTYLFASERIDLLPSSSAEAGNLVEIIGYVVQSLGPINNSPIPDQQVLTIVRGENFGIQCRFKNQSNFQPYYLDNLTSVSAQFLNADGTTLSITGATQSNDDSAVLFELSTVQTAGLMLGTSQSFQVTIVQTAGTSIVPFNESLNIMAAL